MQAIEEGIPLTEHFSFAEITWKIKNISLGLCPSEQRIVSEEFQITGREDTMWRMCLGVMHKTNRAKLLLRLMAPEREFQSMKHQEPGLCVNTYATILDPNGEQPLKYERQFLFTIVEGVEIETFDLSDIVRNLPHTGHDDLTIRCYILIDHEGKRDVPADVPIGLFELSKALNKLIEKPIHSDFKIFVNNQTFYLHKDMFSNIRAMNRFTYSEFKHTILLNHCEYSLASIFNYAYSGNINHIIGAPRIRVAQDIERLDIPELFGAYPREIIPLETTVGVREFTCDWKIEDLEHIEESLNGPEFNVDGTNTRWKICMHPKGKMNGNFQEKKYVFLEATLLECSKKSILANIEFCSLNGKDIVYSRRNHKKMKIGDKIEIPFFLRGGTLMKKCLIDRNLSLRVTLWICTGQMDTIIGNVIPPHPFTQGNSISLTYFSRKMRRILSEGENWDLYLISSNIQYEVHKFVLASRSPFFKNRMNNFHRQILTLPNFRKHFMRIFLDNLYTGLYCDMEFNANCHMYEFGLLFEIEHLKDRFRQEIDFFNLLRVFLYANDNNLLNLRKETFKQIINFGEGISNHPEWSRLFDTRSDIAYGIINYWR